MKKYVIINGKRFIIDDSRNAKSILMYSLALYYAFQLEEFKFRAVTLSRLILNKLKLKLIWRSFDDIYLYAACKVLKKIANSQHNIKPPLSSIRDKLLGLYINNLTVKPNEYEKRYYIYFSLLALYSSDIPNLDKITKSIYINQNHDNYLIDEIYSYITHLPVKLFKDSDDKEIIYGCPWGVSEKESTTPIPYQNRAGYNLWKGDPYRYSKYIYGSKPHGNIHYLLAYWLY